VTGYTYRESSAIARRELRAVESLRSAAADLGAIVPGVRVFALSRGQWSMIDALHHVINELGPCGVSVWTWAIAAYEVETIGGLMARGEITTARLVVDYSCNRREQTILNAWRDRWGDDAVRVVKNHAKLARVWQAGDDGLRVLLRGSANLNSNPRFENFDLSEGDGAFEVVTSIEAGLPVLPRMPAHAEALAATGIGGAWDVQQVQKFTPAGGGKVWRP
jgi:hypothetical protein